MGRRARGLQGVVTTDSKIGGAPGGGMRGQGKTPGNIERVFHVSTVEIKGVHLAGGAGTVATV